MARRPGRCLIALLIVVAAAACATGTDQTDSTGDHLPVPGATSTLATIATTTVPTATTTIPGSTTIVGDGFDGDVVTPVGDGPFPAVVLVHGGGWIAGDPAIMAPLADHLSEHGYLAISPRYQLATRGTPAFPGAVEDVACAVRFAASHPDSDGSVTIIGHSAGAHIGAIVALDGDAHPGDCPLPGTGVPDRFVGLAGPYDSSRLGLAGLAFFGVPESANPELWDSGNPQRLTDANPELDSLIMYGDEDGIVADSFAIAFAAALEGSGSTALLERVEGARHNDMHDPELVGDLIVTWLDRQ